MRAIFVIEGIIFRCEKVGCWGLEIGHWTSVIGDWTSVIGYWACPPWLDSQVEAGRSMDISHWTSVISHWILTYKKNSEGMLLL